MSIDHGIVLFGDVVASRMSRGGTAGWLERLCVDLDTVYTSQTLAGWEFTQGDEIQGLLKPEADPFRAVLRAVLRPRTDAPDMRWVIVYGEVDPGRGPATRRTGPAFLTARETIELARRQRDTLHVRTEDGPTDELLEGTAPVLGESLVALTDRQREIARLALDDGLRQAEIADRFGIRRATVSVAFARAGVRSLGRLLRVVRILWRTGVAAAEGSA